MTVLKVGFVGIRSDLAACRRGDRIEISQRNTIGRSRAASGQKRRFSSRQTMSGFICIAAVNGAPQQTGRGWCDKNLSTSSTVRSLVTELGRYSAAAKKSCFTTSERQVWHGPHQEPAER
jgi:hypothetical protein